MFQEFLGALFLIFMAEMGDKTQILALAFATKFKVKQVLMGIFIGSLLNHGLAVVLGAYVSNFIPLQTIQIVAGFSFIIFALWSLRIEEEAEETQGKHNYGPIGTVAIAFFIGELGDKTQLTTIMLATDAHFPWIVLMGTVSGMVVTGGLGIFIGSKLGEKIPEFTIKIISASIFMFFGISKLYQVIPVAYKQPLYIGLFSFILAAITLRLLYKLLEMRKKEQASYFKQTAQALYEFYHKIHQQVKSICLGENQCGVCQENACLVGYTKNLTHTQVEDEKALYIKAKQVLKENSNKNYDQQKLIEGLAMILKFREEHMKLDKEMPRINTIKENFEMMLFNQKILKTNNISLRDYLEEVAKIDQHISHQIARRIGF